MTARRPWRKVTGTLCLAGVALATALAAASCGRKAEPVPPVVRRAETTRDLTAAQVGDEAILGWSYPTMTTAGGPLPDLEAVEIWRTALPAAQEPVGGGDRDRAARLALVENQGERLAVLEVEGLAAATRGSRLEFRDDLAAWRAAAPGGGAEMVLWYAVRSRCCGGRLSELSNIARLRPEEPPPPPQGLEAVPQEAGIELRWQPRDGLGVIVERSPDGDAWTTVTADPMTGASWTDATAAQGQRWRYRLRAVRTSAGAAAVVGPASPELEVDHADRYPPPPPEEVVCLPEGQRIRVRWRLSPEVSTYRVLRRQDGGPWRSLAEGLTVAEVADDQPPTGEIGYGVEAVDAAGNVSEPATCTAVMSAGP